MASCNYTVLGTKHVMVSNPLGGFEGAQEVSFRTEGSGVQKVTIPDSQFTPETVKAAIEARCSVIADILTLGQ